MGWSQNPAEFEFEPQLTALSTSGVLLASNIELGGSTEQGTISSGWSPNTEQYSLLFQAPDYDIQIDRIDLKLSKALLHK